MDLDGEQAETTSQAEVSLDIAASPGEVWSAITTPEGLAPWMGEGASIDLRPGGTAILPDPVGGITRRGRVDRIEPGRCLDLTWWPALRPAEQTTVSIIVAPSEIGTLVRVSERPLGSATRSARPATASAATADSTPVAPRSSGRPGRPRSMIGFWAWRLALLSVCGCPSLV